MEPSSHSPSRGLRLPGIVWAALAILLAGAAAVTLFGVSIDLALTYGLFALMILGHSVMHAGHGGHGGHAGHGAHPHRADAGGETDEARGADDRPSGGCH